MTRIEQPTSTASQSATQSPAELAQLGLRESATFDRATISDIQRAARTGIYDIRGWGAKRHLPHFDDLLFLGASMSRYPLEGTASAAVPTSCSATASRRSLCTSPSP